MPTTLEQISDEKILSLLQNEGKTEEGFRLLMSKYQEKLYWQVRRLVTHHEDANDVIQNAFIKIYRNIQKFENKSKLYTWLYRIATNEALTYLKKQKRNSSSSIDDDALALENNLKADSYFDGDALAIRLQKAIATLPEKQRIVFNMRYYDEMSYKDISEVLETSEGALKASYHHAVKKIELYFKEIESE